MLTDIEAGLIGVRELADKLAISTRSVWRLIERGEFGVVRIGRRTVIPRTAVTQWLAGKEAPTPSAPASNIGRRFAAQ